MATKKQKRIAGELKAAQDLKEYREECLRAQKIDQEIRARREQDALIERDRRSKKTTHAQATSKIAQEKKERVSKRLSEKEQSDIYERAMDEHLQQGLNLSRREWNEHVSLKHDVVVDEHKFDRALGMTKDVSLKNDVVLMNITSKHPDIDFSTHDDALDLSSVDC